MASSRYDPRGSASPRVAALVNEVTPNGADEALVVLAGKVGGFTIKVSREDVGDPAWAAYEYEVRTQSGRVIATSDDAETPDGLVAIALFAATEMFAAHDQWRRSLD